MSTEFSGFVGPSYEFTNSKYAGVERTVNFYLVANESPTEKKWHMLLAPSPGNTPFGSAQQASAPPAPFNQPSRGLCVSRGTVYGVNGTVAFSLDSSGVFTFLGNVANDASNSPVKMVPTGTGQVFIQSVENGYVIPAGGGANSLKAVTSSGFLGAVDATFQDGYILIISPHSNVFQISGTTQVPLGDATQWSAANVSAQAGQSDYLKAIISSREYIHLMGNERSQIYENVGNNGVGGFPFSNYNSNFSEVGISAVRSLVEMGGFIIWLGKDQRGDLGFPCVWLDNAFTPERISTFSIEQQWQSYARTDDAVAFSYRWQGHLMYQITFPSAIVNNPPSGFPLGAGPTYTSATWVYDHTVSKLLGKPIWHERQFLNAQGQLGGRPELYHASCYGQQLVSSVGGDGNPGAIYQYMDTGAGFFDQIVNGNATTTAIVRDRICPHMYEQFKRIIYNRLEFELARGVGLDGSPPVGTQPVFMVRLSRDGGNTYGVEYTVAAGAIGNFLQRSYLTRLGYARDLVVWVRCSDPVYWSFAGAWFDLFEAGS